MIADLCKHHLANLRGQPTGELLVASPGCPKCPDAMAHLLKRLDLYAQALKGAAATDDVAKYLQRLTRAQRAACGKAIQTQKRPAPAKGTGRKRSA